jgi:FtsZ-binding cell division protein ZapB
VSEKRERQSDGAARLSKLRDRVHQATRLIGELRESNYALSGELAELKREVEALRAAAPSQAAATEETEDEESASESAVALQSELKTLHAERKLIREKVKSILERLDQLES